MSDLIPYRTADGAPIDPWQEIARLKRELAQARFSPMGDNHHNAMLCPYCNPLAQRPEAVRIPCDQCDPSFGCFNLSAPCCKAPARPDITVAARTLLAACEMEAHNEAIFTGKWKKGSKAWNGEFVASQKAAAMARLKEIVG